MAKKESRYVEVPQPKGLPLLGNTLQVNIDAPASSTCEISKPFGPLCQLAIGGDRFIFVNTRDMLHELCDESRFGKIVTADLLPLRRAVHDGLITAHNGERNWGIAHRILMPVFGPLKIRDMFPQMNDLAQQMCLKWARYGEDYEIDVGNDFTRLTLDTISLCGMGYRFNSFHNGTEIHPFVQSMTRVLKEASIQGNIPGFINSLRISSHRKFDKDAAVMREICKNIIQKRRNGQSDPETKDLLDVLLNSKDPETGEKLQEDPIINNLITFLIAGHETTSGMLSFVFYFLMANPRVMEKARAEVDEVTGGSPLAIQHLAKMPYINAILRETLRLQPTVPGIIMAAHKDEVLGGKYRIPATVPLIPLFHLIHRDVAVYGEDAEEFRPERMLDEEFNKLPPNSWKPFGNGMRGCIGRAFAWQEALLITAMLLQTFTFRLADPNYKLKLRESITVKPDGFNLKAKLRRKGDATSLVRELQSQGTDSVKPSTNSRPATKLQNSKDKKPITVLYGSNSGTCESLAYRLAADAALQGFHAGRVAPMNSALKNLPTTEPLILLAASYDGLPADNAAQFFKWLQSLEGSDSLSGVSYAVFGCGHRDWTATLHRVPLLLDQLLEKAGAKRITSLCTADAAVADLFVEVEEWATKSLWPAISHGGAGSSGEERLISSLLDIEVSAPRPLRQFAELKEATVVDTRVLTTANAIGKKVHVEIRLSPDVQYRPGDHIVVHPANPARNIKRALSRFQLTWDAVVRASSGDDAVRIPTDTSMTAYELLSSYFELAQTATPRDIRVLAAAAGDEISKQALSDLATVSYADGIQDKHVSVLDLLEKFPEISVPLGTYLALLPPLRLRTYSISSSPAENPNHATLTFSTIDEPASDGSSRRFLGVASNYLAGLSPGDVIHVAPRSVKELFQMPSDLSTTPIIMVAAGSGLAPFRGFIQERAHQKRVGGKLAPAILFFGCRSQDDDIYREELEEQEASGNLKVYRAFSRGSADPALNICGGYVQDSLTANRESFLSLWQANAKVYVCGSIKLAAQVKDTVIGIVYRAAQEQELSVDLTPQQWFERVGASRYAVELFT